MIFFLFFIFCFVFLGRLTVAAKLLFDVLCRNLSRIEMETNASFKMLQNCTFTQSLWALSRDRGFLRVPHLLDRRQELVIFTPVAECVSVGVPLPLLILISVKLFKILISTFL